MTSPTTGFPRVPRMNRGGFARVDPRTRGLLDVVTFLYNPDTVTRTLQPRAVGGEPGDRLEVLRLTGPPHETIKMDAELDAADQLEHADKQQNSPVAEHGLLPALATLEQMITPTARSLAEVEAMYDQGQMEIIPREAPLVVLVWGADRVLPVNISNLTITEEAFDPALHPLRVKVSIEVKVLTSSDFPAGHIGGAMYLAYRQGVERLAALVRTNDVRPLGLSKLP
jgi:hypothetical protein